MSFFSVCGIKYDSCLVLIFIRVLKPLKKLALVYNQDNHSMVKLVSQFHSWDVLTR